jgi:2,6-dihydroxypyridine 3-monooxygenase
MTQMPRVAVVGGSIGGLTAALLLRDAGCEVDVFERSAAPLTSFGAGIVVQPELVRYFLERTPITLGQISVPSKSIRYLRADSGTLLGEVHAEWRYTSYTALYGGLLKSFGRERYYLGEALVALEPDGEHVELRFATGRVVHCDLAVCADGGFSTARLRLLGVAPKYAGYISWRGLADRTLLSEDAWSFFDERFTYGLLPDSHIIAYPIPVVGEDLRVSGRQVNFQWYWNIDEGPQLDEIMTGRDGMRRLVSVHADDVQERFVEELHLRAKEHVGVHPLMELITSVKRPFVTVIADADTPQMVVGRICLLGDAGVTGRPHAGAGGAKAAADAWALVEQLLEADGDVNRALQRWEAAQLEQGYALLAKVRHMGRVLQSGGNFLPGDAAFRWGLPAVAEPAPRGPAPTPTGRERAPATVQGGSR